MGAALCATAIVYGQEQPRIVELLPNVVCGRLPMEPRIPENYIAMYKTENPNMVDTLYWGPKEVLEKYFEDENSLDQPIISVKPYTLEASFNQKNGWTVHDSTMDNPQARRTYFEMLGYGNHNDFFYPLYLENISYPDRMRHRAFIAIQEIEEHTLEFELIYPKNQPFPTYEQMSFWREFIYGSTILPLDQKMQAQGYDMKIGETIATYAGKRFKVSVNSTDGKDLDVNISGIDSDISFSVIRSQRQDWPQIDRFKDCQMLYVIGTVDTVLPVLNVKTSYIGFPVPVAYKIPSLDNPT